MLTTTWGRGRGRAATRAARAATVAIVFAVAAFASTGARAAAKGLQGAGNGRMGASSGGAKIKRSSGMKRSGAKVDLSGLGGNGGLDLGALLSGGAATAGGSSSRGGSGSSGGLRPHSGGRAGRGSRSGGRTCAIECPLGKALEVNAGYEPYANGCGLDGMPIDLTGGRFDFTPCCDKHDYCYQECGATQKGCDATFGECLRKLCKDEYGGDEECTKLTKTYEMGVGMFGCGPFKDSQRRACKCPELSPAERTTYAAQLRAEAGPSAVPRGKYCGSKSLLVVNVGLEAEVDAEAKTFHLKAWNEEDGTHFFGEDGCGPIPFEAHTDDQVIAGMDPRGFSVAKPYPPCYDQFFGEGGLAAGVSISVRSAGPSHDLVSRLEIHAEKVPLISQLDVRIGRCQGSEGAGRIEL